MSAVLALVLSLALSPEAARALQGPMLFGSGQATFLVLGPAGAGDTLRLARARVRHVDLSATRSFDDAEYRLAVDVPATTRPGQQLTGALWRFGAESPEGRKLEDGVRVEIEREDRVAPAPTRGLAYRALGTPDRLYLVHAGTRFAQILRVQPASEVEIPPGGVPVRVDRPSQEPATRILPGEYAKVVVGEGRTTRVAAQAEIWFSSAAH
ncbi:MAG TPA: hypothetical protein VFD38_05545 [Myxococcaceae bacterium]|nr:hypothetical protein [Myxococcaceae bacterium]